MDFCLRKVRRPIPLQLMTLHLHPRGQFRHLPLVLREQPPNRQRPQLLPSHLQEQVPRFRSPILAMSGSQMAASILPGRDRGRATLHLPHYIYQPSTGQFDTNNSFPAALWIETANPTYEQCTDRISTQALSGDERAAINYEPNLGICVVPFGTDKVVFIRITEQPTGEAAQAFVIMWAPM